MAHCSSFDKLPAAMRTMQPSVFVGVPRVYEKVRQEVERRASPSPVKKRLLRVGDWRRAVSIARAF